MMKKTKSRLKKLALSVAVASAIACTGAVSVTLMGCNKEVANFTPPVEQLQTVEVTVAEVSNGTVVLDKDEYYSGDSVTATITPAEGYKLGSVKVGETDMTSFVTNGTLVIDSVTEATTITVTFSARTAATATVTVKDNVGGTATLNKTSGYVDDIATLTVAPQTGYEVISVKVNDIEKVGELTSSNTLNITFAQAATTIAVEFHAMTIEANISSNDHGTAQIVNKKDEYKIGDIIEVQLAPNAKCRIASLKVNGEEKVADIVNNKLTITVASVGNINIAAEFEIIPVACKVDISATKYNETFSVAGLSATLSHKTTDKEYKGLTVGTDGKLSAEVIPGEYTLTVDGFVPVTVTVGDNGGDISASTVYQLFDYNNSDGWNIDTLTDGYITSTGTFKLAYSNDAYSQDFIATMRFTDAAKRQFFVIKLANDKLLGFGSDDGTKMSFMTGFGPYDKWGIKDNAKSHWYHQEWDYFGLTDSEKTQMQSTNGIEVKVVRKGNRLSVFAGTDNRLVQCFAGDDILGGEIEFLVASWTVSQFPVSIGTKAADIDALVESSATATVSGDNTLGTVTLDKTGADKYYFGDTATLTVAPKASSDPNKAYVLKSLTLDGTDVIDKVADNTFKFTVNKKTHALVAEFQEVSYASLHANISAVKYGVAQTIDKVWLSSTSYSKKEHSFNNGRLEVDRLPEGEYTIEVDGYIPAKVNVTKTTTSYDDIMLNWQIFGDKKANINTDLVQDKYNVQAKGIINLKDTFTGDFVYTTAVKHFNQGESNRVYMLARFVNDNKVLCIGANSDAWHGIHCMDVGADAVWSAAEVSGGYIDARAGSWLGMPLTDAEWAADQRDGITLKLVRKGNSMFLFVGHTPEGGQYTERLFRTWSGDSYAQGVQFGYINFSNNAFTTPINVSEKQSDIDDLAGNRNLNASITFNKYGETQTVTAVTLKNSAGQAVTGATVSNGTLTAPNLPMDIYTLEAEGYAPHTIDLYNDSTKAIVMQYQFFDSNDYTVGSDTFGASKWNIDNLDKGYITAKDFAVIYLKDTYDNFVFTANVKKASRNYFSIHFKEQNKVVAISTPENANEIQIIDYGNAPWAGSTMLEGGNGNEFKGAFDSDEISAYNGGGLDIKIVRNSDKIYVFAGCVRNGVYSDRLVISRQTSYPTGAVDMAICAFSAKDLPVSMDTTQSAVDAMVAKVTA